MGVEIILKKFTMTGKILFTMGFILFVLSSFLYSEFTEEGYWKMGLIIGALVAISSNFFTNKRSSKRRA
ncbi:hypothetical protein VL03_09475 [Rossellomorea marisflavi]|nr:hypothetical protein VL03_09475 [Rossellomorea marisflavi]